MSQIRKKRSVIWAIPRQDLQAIVNSETSVSAVLRRLGFGPAGASWNILKKRFDQDKIDHFHFGDGFQGLREANRKRAASNIPFEIFFSEGSTVDRKSLKRRILKEKLIEERCADADCGNGPWWNGKPLILVLDHINGVYNDNRLENLRFLCPNCNSQQETFAGRNVKPKSMVDIV